VTLDCLACGQAATLVRVGGETQWRRRLLELGFIPGTAIVRVGQAPMGDPLTYRIRGALVALRIDDAKGVEVCALRTEHGIIETGGTNEQR
jgi:ferrous iron transport protein A